MALSSDITTAFGREQLAQSLHNRAQADSALAESRLTYQDIINIHDQFNQQNNLFYRRYTGNRPFKLSRFTAEIRVSNDALNESKRDAIEHAKVEASHALAKQLMPYMVMNILSEPTISDPYEMTNLIRFSIQSEIPEQKIDNYMEEIDKLIRENAELRNKLEQFVSPSELPKF